MEIDERLWAMQKSGVLTVPEVIQKRAEEFTENIGYPQLSEIFRLVFKEELTDQTAFVDNALEILE